MSNKRSNPDHLPGGRYRSPETMARREKLRKLLIDNPLAMTDIERLAGFLGVSSTTVRADLRALKDSLPERMDGELALRIVSVLDRIEKAADKLAKDGKGNVKVAALRLQLDATKEGLGLLERLGIVKPKGASSEAPPVSVVMQFDASGYPAPPSAKAAAQMGKQRKKKEEVQDE